MISVEEVISLALPKGTQVVAGRDGLGREVTWATRLRSSPPAFGHLTGGELVLLPAAVLELLDERLTLEAAVRQLAGFGIAAVAHIGAVTAGARAAAEQAGVPLLRLPKDADLGVLEREASRLITERRRDVQRRGQEVGRRLMEFAIAGESLPTIVRGLADLAQRVVALEGRDGQLLAYHAANGRGPSAATVEPLLRAGHAALASWLQATAASSPAEPPTATYALDTAFSRVVAPVRGRDGLLGSLSLIVPAQAATPEDGLLTSRGAAACAVVLAREQATASTRRELELNVLDEILDGALRSEVTLVQQAKRLGHDLALPHVALIARLEQSGPVRHREGRWAGLDEVMTRRGASAFWRIRNNSAEIVWPVPTAGDARQVGEAVLEELEAGTAGGRSEATVALGVGRPGQGLAGIRQSYQEARQALTIGRRLGSPTRLTAFDDLGIYRVIFAAEGLPELGVFREETLGTLIDYDRIHNADLLRTLDAFFAGRCSPKEAAALLHVHRNTVLYRLDRIREITGFDLDAADVRLRLQFALHVQMALHGNDGQASS